MAETRITRALVGLSGALLVFALGACSAPTTPAPSTPAAVAEECRTPQAELISRTPGEKQVLVVRHDHFDDPQHSTTDVIGSFTPTLQWRDVEPNIPADDLPTLLTAGSVELDLEPLALNTIDLDQQPHGETLSYRFVQPEELEFTVGCAGDEQVYRARATQATQIGTVVLDCLPAEHAKLETQLLRDYCEADQWK